jgi:crotonobetainyl-CoA:carnitine CoA-transferase CaiB-like acyl-CoA transferase
LLEAQIQMLDFQASRWLIKGEVPKQAGNDHPTGIPTGVFPTADGHINIAASGQNLYERLCKAIGAEDLPTHPDYATPPLRSKNRKALNERIAAITRTKPSAFWDELLYKAGVPCGPINTIEQTFNDPQVRHLGIAKPVDHATLGPLKVVGQAINLSATPQPAKLRRPSPDLGEHSDEILKDIGYDDGAIAALRQHGVV